MNSRNDLGIDALINTLNSLKQEASFGPEGKKFEDQIKFKLESKGFRELSFNKKSPLFFLERIKIFNENFETCRKLIRNAVLDKKNFQPIPNFFKDFITNNNIYIYINLLVSKIFLIFWLSPIIELYLWK